MGLIFGMPTLIQKMKMPVHELEQLCEQHPKLLSKGGLCVALVVTRHARERGLPLEFKSLRTEGGGQVIGLGKAAVQKILESHGIKKVLAEEGGRTSRGSLGLMKEYVGLLNTLHQRGNLDIEIVEEWWIEKVRIYPAPGCLKLRFDQQKSLGANIGDLLAQMEKLPSKLGPAKYVNAMLQHLVGSKLDLVLGPGKVKHHGFRAAYHSMEHAGDFQIDSVTIHVTTHPTEALARKCADNLNHGLKPIIITTKEGMVNAAVHLRDRQLTERVDVLDCSPFLTANLYEHSLFKVADCKVTFTKLLERYNQIVDECEPDAILRVELN
jgi:hypothetical protein